MMGYNPSKDFTDPLDEAEIFDAQNRPFDILARYEDQRSLPPVNRSNTHSSLQKARGWFPFHWLGSLWRSQEHSRDSGPPDTSKNAGKTISQSENPTRSEDAGVVSLRNGRRASTFPANKVTRIASRHATFPISRQDERSNAPPEVQRNARTHANALDSSARLPERLRKSPSQSPDIWSKTPHEENNVRVSVSRSPQRVPSISTRCSNRSRSPEKDTHTEGYPDKSLDRPMSQPQDVVQISSDPSHLNTARDQSSSTKQRESPPEVDLKTVAIFANQAARDSGYFSQSTQRRAMGDSWSSAFPGTIEVAIGRSFTTASKTTDHLKMSASQDSTYEDDTYRDVNIRTMDSPTNLDDISDFKPKNSPRSKRRRRDSQQTSISEISIEYADLRFEDFDVSAIYMGGQFPEYDFQPEIDEEPEQVDGINENDRRMVEKRKRDLAPVLTLSASKGTGHNGAFESLLDPGIPSRSLGYGIAHWMLQKFVHSWTELCRFIHLSTVSSTVCSSVDVLSGLVGYIHLDALVCANWFWDANTITCSGGKSTGQMRAVTSYIPSIDSASIDVPHLYTQIFVENSDAGSADMEIYHLSRRIHRSDDTQEVQKSPDHMKVESPSYSLEDLDYNMAPIAISLGTSPSNSSHPISPSTQSLRSRVSSRHPSFSYPRPHADHHNVSPTG